MSIYTIKDLSNNILELYNDDHSIDTKIDELIIPSPIESFVSDIYCKKLILPESLKVLDLWYDYDNSLEFNIPYNIKNIKMRYANILNKSFINLFPLNGSFRFIHCKLNNIELNIVLHQYYNKCFNNNIKNICTYEEYKALLNNRIYSKSHAHIIEQIQEYEYRISQGMAFCILIKDELLEKAYHPNKICKYIRLYGIRYLEKI